jgi:hyperosmotically inducible periplasmic protein
MMPKLLSASLLLLLCATALPAQKAAQPPPTDNTQTAPDNSRTNQRDRNQGATTADQQNLNSADQKITSDIRSSIMKDKSLSTYAHNVKVVTQDGKVTVKGPVRSEEEKSSIVAKAKAVAGAGNVTDEIEVAPSSDTGSNKGTSKSEKY